MTYLWSFLDALASLEEALHTDWLTDWFMVSQTISFVPSIWSDSHSIWSSTIQSLIQITCEMVWDRLRVLVSVPHLRLFTGPPLSFTGPLIFSVGSLGLWITPKLSTHLLFKKGQICGAAMCAFQTHFVENIKTQYSYGNNIGRFYTTPDQVFWGGGYHTYLG